MNRSFKLAIACCCMAFGQQSAAQSGEAMTALVEQDVRLATIAERMLGANRDLCRQHMPLTGLVLHSRDQYGATVAGSAFANGRIAIAAVVPGSAASASVAPGDAIAAIAATRSDTLVAEGEAPLRDSAFELFAAQPAGAPLALAVVHDGRERAITLEVPTGCRALVEIRATSGLNARSDGRVIQINYGLAAQATDEELAVIFAHEMGHLVLEHRRRLSAAGVEKGFFGEFGRNQQLNRQVEVEADRIAAHLLANAGYDPAIAPKFWRSSLGGRASGGLLRSSTYPSAEARAQLIEREIAEYIGAGAAPTWPGHLLARRDTPFE
jgi:Zn-dependent protease with chaperone function